MRVIPHRALAGAPRWGGDTGEREVVGDRRWVPDDAAGVDDVDGVEDLLNRTNDAMMECIS
ncbi:hypothetical protein L1080_032595 [Rhodococcus sp. MSC1_016]